MIEPPRPDRDIDLGGPPGRAFLVAMLKRRFDAISALAWEGHGVRVDGRPVGITGDSALVAAPAHIGTRVGEDHRSRLEPANEAEHPWPVIHLAAAVRPLTVGAVEPDFGDASITCQELSELGGVDVVIRGGIAVAGMVSVPRREIQSRPEPFGGARVDELSNDVAGAAAPWTARDGMPRRRGWPEAEPVVMLRGQDHGAEPRLARRARPLACVKTCRIEDARRLAPVSPLAIREGVHAEVKKHRELISLPGQLRGRGKRQLPRDALRPAADAPPGGERDGAHLDERSAVHARRISAGACGARRADPLALPRELGSSR